jgi:hypothetical protein
MSSTVHQEPLCFSFSYGLKTKNPGQTARGSCYMFVVNHSITLLSGHEHTFCFLSETCLWQAVIAMFLPDFIVVQIYNIFFQLVKQKVKNFL